MKAIRGEEEEEEEEEVEAEEAPLGEGTAPQKPDFSDFFRAPAGDGIPAKNHDDEDEERLSGTSKCTSNFKERSRGRSKGRSRAGSASGGLTEQKMDRRGEGANRLRPRMQRNQTVSCLWFYLE